MLNNKIDSFLKNKVSFMLILFFVITKLGFGQIANYVSNGSFEALNPGVVAYSWNGSKYWQPLDSINKIAYYLCTTTPSIQNAPNVSFGFQYPRTGNSFVGTQFFCDNCGTNSRGYPRNRLKQKLQAGKTYCAKYYVVNTNNNRVAIANYGIYFGDSSLDTITKCMWPITYLTPQVVNTTGIITDTLNWVAITGTFVANGTEKYMVLGNFKSNATTSTLQLNTPVLSTQTADLYIDDVSVIEIDLTAYAGPDIWAIPGNTLYLGRPQDVGIDEACMWYKLPNITTAIDTAAGITVTVGITTNTYIVRQDICGNVKWDTVVVHASGVGIVSSSGVENSVVKIFPQPSDEILNIELDVYKETEFKLKIFNNLNQLVREEVLRQAQQSNGNLAFKIKTDNLPNGVYVLKLLDTASPTRSDNGVSVSKRFVINR